MTARKSCSVIECPNLAPCEDHPKIPWAGSNRRAELPPDWSHCIVPRILRRDPVCTDGIACGRRSLSVEVHHTGDPSDHSDGALSGVCKACHALRTQQQAAEARLGT